MQDIEQIKNASSQSDHSPIQTYLYRFRERQLNGYTNLDGSLDSVIANSGIEALKNASELASFINKKKQTPWDERPI